MITIMRHSLLDTLLHAKMVSVNAWINADTMFLPVKGKLQPAKHGVTICRPMTNDEIETTKAQLNQLKIKHNF